MAKVPPKKKSGKPPQPEAAQLRALERLMAARDYPEAAERALNLVKRFPDYSGTRRLLVEALERSQGRAAATLAAYQWVELKPNSLPALEALLRLAAEGGHPFLAKDIVARMRALGAMLPDLTPQAATWDELRRLPDGTLATTEVLTHFDIGKVHMDAHDFAGAARLLEGVAVTPARNNRALAQFHLGNITEALRDFMDAWQAEPDNLFALGWALQLRLYQGDESGAQGLAVPMAQAQARRVEDAHAQVLSLLMVREDRAAWEAWERSSRTAWASDPAGPRTMRARWLHLGACAACRFGLGDRARVLWRQALDLEPGLTAAQVNLDTLAREGKPLAYPELFDQGQVLPIVWLRALRTGGAEGAESRVDALSASDAYLEALYVGGDELLRQMATLLLTRRLDAPVSEEKGGHRRAAAILRGLAGLPLGTSRERLGLLHSLRNRNLIAADEAAQFWDGQTLSEVHLGRTEISREPVPSDLPDDLAALLDEAVSLQVEGRLDQAEACLDAIRGRVPDHPVALGNLAGIRASQRRDQEALEILRRLTVLHPDYLFARCNLASILIEAGSLDEAQGLLAGLGQRPRLHIQEAFSLYGVTAMLHRARGEDAAADALIASLERMTEDEHDKRLLAMARRRLDRVTALGRVLGPE